LLETIMEAQVREFPVHKYMFASMTLNAHLVTEALDAAVGVGLLDKLLDDEAHSLPMYTSFYSGLIEIAGLDDNAKRPLKDWTKQHLVMGMVRLLDSCIRFRKDLLPNNIRKSISDQIAPRITEAKSYLGKLPTNTA